MLVYLSIQYKLKRVELVYKYKASNLWFELLVECCLLLELVRELLQSLGKEPELNTRELIGILPRRQRLIATMITHPESIIFPKNVSVQGW